MSTNLTKQIFSVSKYDRRNLLKQKSPVIWLTGLSGSGKSTIANELALRLHNSGKLAYILDGDNIRSGLNSDLGFTDDDRKENIRRIAEVAKLLSDSGVIVITAFISPFIEERQRAKEIIGEDFTEVYLSTSLEVCESRDPKGLYKKARLGQIKQFTGIDSAYESPKTPDLQIDTNSYSVAECANIIQNFLNDNNPVDWERRNHGGQPTDNKDKKRAIFIGRWQPYHSGHINLVEQKLKSGTPALIMVRDIEPDEKNPFTTAQTVSMIEKYHKSKGHDVEVVIIPDIESVNWGRGVGYEVNEWIPTKEVANISATKIRESIKSNNNDWRKMVDSSIQEDVIKYLSENAKAKNISN
jgi:adenylylsulfate kinase